MKLHADGWACPKEGCSLTAPMLGAVMEAAEAVNATISTVQTNTVG
jgi:hypothetical protein